MKYMGAKTSLLKGRFGDLVLGEAAAHDRFLDLFAGTGAVSHHVASNLPIVALTFDIQNFAALLCASRLTYALTSADHLQRWVAMSSAAADERFGPGRLPALQLSYLDVTRDRERSSISQRDGFITSHYGGHYFSYRQAAVLDILEQNVPKVSPDREVALAALIRAASRCSASPGHTAQPFQPSDRLLPHISGLWSRDPLAEAERALQQITSSSTIRPGRAIVADANIGARHVRYGDLVFLDPPYSAAQYSRFYHVLEGIALGGWGEIGGAGRMPRREFRTGSIYSTTRAPSALAQLLAKLHSTGATIMMTFPDAETSNRLSGQLISSIASRRFHVEIHGQDADHSSLGGKTRTGAGRRRVKELIFTLRPR